ncbi:sarcosine oxidase subunit alpha family protein [Phaeovulum sp.]|uniref:sarcosine oxidase subunit alpha family protein n=1 Tax=Phaeovulum sp. TaxID=2934796 RepID=UPI003561D0D7
MSTRLATGGRLIDRTKPLAFSFDGRAMRGFAGDTLAAALLANDQMLIGRSFKYHRPRGILASGVEEPNAMVALGQGPRLEPDQRTTTTELFEGATTASQNAWPSLDFDVGALNNLAYRFLPAGFYYKTFMFPRFAWKHLFEPLVRQSAGIGPVPKEADPDRYEQAYDFTDVLVAGGGVAGLTAALAAASTGQRVLLLEQTPHWGGRAPVDGIEIEGKPADAWVAETVAALAAMPNVILRNRCMVAGVYDHGYVVAQEAVADHLPGADLPRHRLWRIRAGRVIAATGAIERPLAFAANDTPGVMLASAVRDYVVNWAVSPGDRTVVVTNNDDAYRTALALLDAGLVVPAILDARASVTGELPALARARGIRVLEGRGVAKVKGGKRVRAVEVCVQAGEGAVLETIACDCVAMSGGFSPVVHLFSQPGGKLLWDAANGMFTPDPARAPTGADGAAFVACAGAASGALQAAACLADAHAVGGGKAKSAPKATAPDEAPMQPVWMMPQGAPVALRFKMLLDFQNDVKVSDVQLAAREGYESVEHTKRYTTLGMASDQGKMSNINGLAILSDALGQPIPATGTTTFRPPYAPISFGAVAGEARGAVFAPLRRTPMHAWHEAQGAHWEPVGLWRRPYCYPRAGETHAQAVNREVTNTRNALGLLDASTLGKILVKGPDAGRFLDMIYTGVMSTLPVGKCRYGLTCNENGFLIDDGVVARLSEDSWLCHTTSGGADRIHAHMEDWLQCEWWDWKVYTANLTEQFAQVAIVGPNARKLLEKLGGMDVSREALPFMTFAEGTLAGIAARVFRISFSGELSYEVAVPAAQGMAFWTACLEAGTELGLMPYGTEAVHVLRAEKGFIIVGDETDGTVIPQDLGLGWAISKKKPDYLGKRAQERSHMTNPDRWRLVGLETLDGSVLPDGVLAPAPGVNANGQRNTQGRVTSTYFSPTLGRGIAMGLVRQGPERMGEVLDFVADGKTIKARICDQVFYDKDGEKQNV